MSNKGYYKNYQHKPNNSVDKRIKKFGLKKLVSPDKTLLDIGCSNGEFVRKLAPLCLYVGGIDPNFKWDKKGGDNWNLESTNFDTYWSFTKTILFTPYDIVLFFAASKWVCMYDEMDEKELVKKLRDLCKVDSILVYETHKKHDKDNRNHTKRMLSALSNDFVQIETGQSSRKSRDYYILKCFK